MRSAAFFEADNERRKAGRGGRRVDTRRVPQARADVVPARDEFLGEDLRTPATDDRKKPGKSWFLHDDRDGEDGVPGQRRAPNDDRTSRNRRVERTGGTPRDSAVLDTSAEVRPSKWEYVDPKGNIQGPFPASDLVKWSNGGFFSADQKVRRAGQQAFVPLRSVLPELVREAEGKKLSTSRVQANSRGAVVEVPKRAVPQYDARTREPRPVRPAGRAGYQGQHPADALLSPDEAAARAAADAPPNRQGDGFLAPREPRGGRGGRGRGGYDAEAAGRGGQGFRERGGRGGGRGGDGSGRGTAPARSAAVGVGDASEARLPYNYKVAQKLFTGEAELATDEPVWRYIDPSGTLQGPFPARNMLEWYRKGMLHDMGLMVCGAERKVAPPDVPLPVHYHKLGDLLDSVKRGQRFAAASVDDVRSGTARPLLLLPKGPREDGRPASGARKADSSKAGKQRKGSSAPRAAKAAEAPRETVTLKLEPTGSGDDFKAVLTVVPPPAPPVKGPPAKASPASAAAADKEPAANSSSGAAEQPAAVQSAAPMEPAAELLLSKDKGAADKAAEAEAGEIAAATAASGASVDADAAPKTAAEAAPAADAPAAAGAPSEPKHATDPKETSDEAPKADAAANAPVAADEPTAVDEQKAAPAAAQGEVETIKPPSAAAAANAVEPSSAEPAAAEDAAPAVGAIEEVKAVIASNVSAVEQADESAPDSIKEALPAATKPAAKETPPPDAGPNTEAATSAPAEGTKAAPAEGIPKDADSSAPAEHRNGAGVAAEKPAEAPVTDMAKPIAASEAVPVKEAAVKESTAEVAKAEVEKPADAKEAPAKAMEEEEKPKEQTSMFKSALKMFQGK